MDHVAIMSKSTGLIEKILQGHKTIESRWYATRRPPWGKVRAGDVVYFKYSGGVGERVKARAKVDRVQQFENVHLDGTAERVLGEHGPKIFGTPDEVPLTNAAPVPDAELVVDEAVLGSTKRRRGRTKQSFGAEREGKTKRQRTLGEESVAKDALWRGKRYCILVWLVDVEEIEDPFLLDKRGFGKMTAWLTVPSISQIRLA
jgi:ASC-1-like (ASCH) protein